VVDAEAVQNRCVEIVNVYRVFEDVVTELVGLAVTDARLDAAPGHPDRVTTPVMVTAVIVLLDFSLTINGATEFAAPDHERVVQEPALLEVFNERGTGLVGVLALLLDALGQVAVLIPAPMIELNKPHAALGHAPGEQTVVGESAGLLHVGAVHLEHALRLLG